MVAFSSKPLSLATLVGFTTAFIGLVAGVVYVGQKVYANESMTTGMAPAILLISLLGGIQLIAFGIMGEYIGRIYEEVRNRPKYLLARKVGTASAKCEEKEEK